MTSEFHYVGEELDLFSQAKNWKSYWSSFILPFVGSEVLDVGAGTGATAKLLATSGQKRWLCLEPDPSLASRIEDTVRSGRLPATCTVRVGTIQDLEVGQSFDTIIYADVLEHIADDRKELEMASARLRPGGHLIVLSPSIQWLYSPFDKALGHFRRYSKATLRAVAPQALVEVKVSYLDSVGMLASAGNKLVLNTDLPSPGQIGFWDGVLVPISRALDPLVGRAIGKSIIAIWKRV
jgi:2-polyprenyl-3-methyl-5-hydroxy-6-metoxy-1,4-benzoquinol methylase